MDGVAEDGVGVGDAGAGEGGGFALVGGDVDEGVGDDAVGDADAGGEDAVGGDAEALDALFDDPVVGGADGPDLDVAGAEFVDEGEHLGEDVLLRCGSAKKTRAAVRISSSRRPWYIWTIWPQMSSSETWPRR